MSTNSSFVQGQKFGLARFTLQQQLGRGGMGMVWLARDERLAECSALKFLPPEVQADHQALETLRKETIRARRLTHPNIIRIHDLHESPDEPAFISMEYVAGKTLSELCRQQPDKVFPWDTIVPWVNQLSEALAYAHGEGVIHRDLKPSNMMVDEKGRLKLADFGIAAIVSDSMSRFSVQNASSGTPTYMSPQQMAGKPPQPTDDIYAVGATLYHLLTSRPPFYTGTITYQVDQVMPATIPQRLQEFGIRNEVPPRACEIIMACLAKDPGKRPANAREIWQYLNPTQTYRVTPQPAAATLASLVASRTRGAVSVDPTPSPSSLSRRTSSDHSSDQIYATSTNFRPYRFGGGEYFSAAMLAGALAQNWPEGIKHLERGFILEWVRHQLVDASLASVLTDISEDTRLSSSQKLSAALLALNPGAPLHWQGNDVTPDWFATHGVEAIDLLKSPLPEWLSQLRQDAWLVEARTWEANLAQQALAARSLGQITPPITGKEIETRLQKWHEVNEKLRLHAGKVFGAPLPMAVVHTINGAIAPGRAELDAWWKKYKQNQAGVAGGWEKMLNKGQYSDVKQAVIEAELDFKDLDLEPIKFLITPWENFWKEPQHQVQSLEQRLVQNGNWQNPKPLRAELDWIKQSLNERIAKVQSNYSGMEYGAVADEELNQVVVLAGKLEQRMRKVKQKYIALNSFAFLLVVLAGLAMFLVVKPRPSEPIKPASTNAPSPAPPSPAPSSAVDISYLAAFVFDQEVEIWEAIQQEQNEKIAQQEETRRQQEQEIKLWAERVFKQEQDFVERLDQQEQERIAKLPKPGKAWTNSLGMVFTPVAETKVLFGVWEVRVQDYDAFVSDTQRSREKPDFEQGPTHPVANVSWEDARAFCQWLKQKELNAGLLRNINEYRLPTDAEWTLAVALSEPDGATPKEKMNKNRTLVYPWGTAGRLPYNAGNYAAAMRVDDYPFTSPVGSFRANSFGLFDLGGNVLEWCEDWFDSEQKERVLRGGSWGLSDQAQMLSSYRRYMTPDSRRDYIGFRVVLVVEGAGN